MKNLIGKVNIVPSWVAQVGMCRAIIEESKHSKSIEAAWAEIFRAAELADEYVRKKEAR